MSNRTSEKVTSYWLANHAYDARTLTGMSLVFDLGIESPHSIAGIGIERRRNLGSDGMVEYNQSSIG